MIRRDTWALLAIVIFFVAALWVVLPVDAERLGRKGLQFGLDLKGGVRLVYQADLSSVDPGTEDEIMNGVIAVIANRVNPLGVTEPKFERRGADQIVVELPGMDISDAEKERIGRTALLEFRELAEVPVEGSEPEAETEASADDEDAADDEVPAEDDAAADGNGEAGDGEEDAEANGEAGDGEEDPEANGEAGDEVDEEEPVAVTLKWIAATGIIDGKEKVLNSSYFKSNTYVDRTNFGEIQLAFEWTEEGAKLSEQITSRLIGQPLGIFEGEGDDALPLLGDDGVPIAPVIRAVITNRGVITGISLAEATMLSQQLNAGRLPVPLRKMGEQTVDPTLGKDFIELSVRAGIIGIVLVMLFMIAYYRVSGVMASLALVFYGVVVMAVFKMMQVTLTLAGIGGFVLSLGMAVDANVLIFERMKEELRSGQTLRSAIESGFNRAWTAIRDSNITTMIVCVILIWVGSSIAFGGSVQGFGVTLLVGVSVSMLTAILVTRTFLRLFVGTDLARRPYLFSAHLGRKDA